MKKEATALTSTCSTHYITLSNFLNICLKMKDNLKPFAFQSPSTRLLGHPLVSDHMVSRSYLPSAAGQTAYYQAETLGGLAVCQPLTRLPNHHHFQGESPAEEVRCD